MHDGTDTPDPRPAYEPPTIITLGAVTTTTLGQGGSSSRNQQRPAWPWMPKIPTFPSGPRGRH